MWMVPCDEPEKNVEAHRTLGIPLYTETCLPLSAQELVAKQLRYTSRGDHQSRVQNADPSGIRNET